MRIPSLKRSGFPLTALALALFAISATACGTDFSSAPSEASASEPTPPAVPTIFRTVDVTPAPTSTPVPLEEGAFYSRGSQRSFPSDLDNADTKTPLPADTVTAIWESYLTNAHIVIPDRRVDVHLCEDRRIIPGFDENVVERGTWAVRQSDGDWFEVVVGREFRRNRLNGFATLSRNGGRTVTTGDDGLRSIALVSVTDSDQCGQ